MTTKFNSPTTPFGYVWRKAQHSPMFYFTEAEALNTQRLFGGEIVKVYTHD
jgi:hypothetical protein